MVASYTDFPLGGLTVHVDAFLADSVVSAEGKLYAQGAGWNVIYTNETPFRHNRVGVGILITVPYTATNQMHRLVVHIEDSDGAKIALGDAPPGTDSDDGHIYLLGGEFNVGRPPLLIPGDDQIVPIA